MADKPTEDQMLLASALERHGYDDWYSAILHAVMEEGIEDVEEVIKLADAAFEKNPTDPSSPSDDDDEALLVEAPR